MEKVVFEDMAKICLKSSKLKRLMARTVVNGVGVSLEEEK